MKTHTRPEGTMPEQVPLVTLDAPPSGLAVPAPRGGSPSKVFRPWSPEQTALLPASKRDYLGDETTISPCFCSTCCRP